MPRLDMFSWAVWIVAIGSEIGLSWLMRAHWRRWTAIAVFVWFKTAVSLLLLATYFDAWGYDNTPAAYFYGYWIAAAIASILQVWIIVEVCASALPLLARNLVRAIPALCVVYLCGALFIVGNSPLTFPLEETRLVVNLDRGASLAWLTVFICLYYASATIAGIRWGYREIGVAIGLTLKMIGETGVSWLLGVYPRHWQILSQAAGVIWIMALLAWFVTFLAPERPSEDQPQLEGLKGILKTYIESLKRLRS